MNATALIVELVLAGILMLAALLLPAVAVNSVNQAMPLPQGLDGTALVAVAVAAGFVLGVLVDRAADSLLDRWLVGCRFRFALGKEVKRNRERLIGFESKTTGLEAAALVVKDFFPEDWMRDQVGKSASQPFVDNLTQLRIRIRVARNMAVLTPALTMSAAVALCLHNDESVSGAEMWFVPTFHLMALLALVLLADAPVFKTPRTNDDPPMSSEDVDGHIMKWIFVSPGVLWFATQLAVTAIVLARAPQMARPLVGWALVLGATVTALAVWAWWRMIRTYFATIWNYCRFNRRRGLIGAMLRSS